LNPASGDLNLS